MCQVQCRMSTAILLVTNTILQHPVALCRFVVRYTFPSYLQLRWCSLFFTLLRTYTITHFGPVGYVQVYKLILHCRSLQSSCY